jgi:amidohydrolase
MNLKQQITELSQKYFKEIVEIRRHLHMYPELSYNEHETSRYIKEQLDKIGLSYQTVFNTGLTGILRGSNPDKKTIALRADIDALPVEEKTELDFASKNPGKMHACGHDVHTASLLGTLKILNDLKDQFEGSIRFIFQPAEEKLPGGAQQLIKEGVLENPKPSVIIGQHVYPELPAGTVGFKPGPYMASSDEIFLTIKGKGGHGAMPHKITDTVLLASQVVTTLHQTINRLSPPNVPTVLSLGKFIANGATNVIPDIVEIEGTFRTMNEEWRTSAHEKIKNTIQSIVQNAGADCDIIIKKGYPVLINHEHYTSKSIQLSQELLGENNINLLEKRMTAEDFAYYCHEIPGVFYRLGTGNPLENNNPPLHSSNFMVDENSIQTGMSNMAWLAVRFLKEIIE